MTTRGLKGTLEDLPLEEDLQGLLGLAWSTTADDNEEPAIKKQVNDGGWKSFLSMREFLNHAKFHRGPTQSRGRVDMAQANQHCVPITDCTQSPCHRPSRRQQGMLDHERQTQVSFIVSSEPNVAVGRVFQIINKPAHICLKQLKN